jgi:acetylornithine/succinyldiaminopimelate/putrescine aminotransferase
MANHTSVTGARLESIVSDIQEAREQAEIVNQYVMTPEQREASKKLVRLLERIQMNLTA